MAAGVSLPRRPRRYGQWAATATFVLVAALGAGWVYQAKGDTVEVLVLRHSVAAGQVLSAEDLGTVAVSGVPGSVPVADADMVIGKRAVVGMVIGQILASDSVTDAPLPGPGQGLTSLSLPRGRIPAGLASGDPVIVLAVPAEGTAAKAEDLDDAPVLADDASVYAVEQNIDGDAVVTLLLDEADARRVATYGAVGQATLIESSIVPDE